MPDNVMRRDFDVLICTLCCVDIEKRTRPAQSLLHSIPYPLSTSLSDHLADQPDNVLIISKSTPRLVSLRIKERNPFLGEKVEKAAKWHAPQQCWEPNKG